MNPVAHVTYEQPSATVTAHLTGGPGPLSFTSAMPATCSVASVAGDAATATATVLVLGAGICTVTVSQAGSADWAPATVTSDGRTPPGRFGCGGIA